MRYLKNAGTALCAVLLALVSSRISAQTFEVIHSFDVEPTNPYGPVIRGSDGAVYGTTVFGGAKGYGVVFKINKDGGRLLKLHDFNGADGANPYAGLLEGSDGALYGTANQGGANGFGIVFKVNRDGTEFQKLHDFNNIPDGAYPYAGLLEGSDGAVYGTTIAGGANGRGGVFKINKDGSGFLNLHAFNKRLNGAVPYAGVVEGSDGALYGTTYAGGASGFGVVYKLNKDGSGFLKLGDFNNTGNGAHPYAGVVEGSDGLLYGTTYEGGPHHGGVVFKLNKDGSGFVRLREVGSAYAGLLEGSDGALYGTTLYGGRHNYGLVFKINKDGSGFRGIHNFNYDDGSRPYAGLVQGSDGAFYGTTNLGGDYRDGVVFRLEESSGFRLLHAFGGGNGASPYAGLVEGSDGGLYGTTYLGGDHRDGVVYKLNEDGSAFQKLHDFFEPNNGDGSAYAGLIEGSDGALYGTTIEGSRDVSYRGTIFKVNKDGTGFKLVHDYEPDGIDDGADPYAGLIEGSDGALYGTTSLDGANGAGVAFTLAKDGSGYLNLHDFNDTDGANPYAGLVEGNDGALYGTTVNGGASGYGVVFKVNKDGSGFERLHDFNVSDGANPYAGLVEGSDGILYGTTTSGGIAGLGVVFSLNKDGSGFLKLHDFHADDGANPHAAVMEGFDGALYGTTVNGGANELGVVFKLKKDGTGFSILHDFDLTAGANPYAALVERSAGVFYGTTVNGGPGWGGVVYRLTSGGGPSWEGVP